MLDLSKFKALADNNFNLHAHVANTAKFILDRVENIVGKGKNADIKHFLLFQQCYRTFTISGLLKDGIVWYSKTVQ